MDFEPACMNSGLGLLSAQRPPDDDRSAGERSGEVLEIGRADEDVVERMEEYREALGDDIHFVFRPYTTGIDTEDLMECIERLGEEVVLRL